MSSHFFDSFADASAFAKQVANNNKKHTIKREGVRFIVEVTPGQNTFQENKFESVDVPRQILCICSESNNLGASNQTEMASNQREAESAIRQQQAQATLKQWFDESNAKEKAKRRRAKATTEQRRVTQPVNEQDKAKPKGKLERFNAKLHAWEAEAPLRAAQAEEHKQRVSELSYKGGANKNKICPICGYSLVPNPSSSNYCKCQRHTNYGINEGIAGTREANKKMRGRGG
jgi:hypothetical protein